MIVQQLPAMNCPVHRNQLDMGSWWIKQVDCVNTPTVRSIVVKSLILPINRSKPQ
jgi:hypothetical protein